MYAGQKHLDNLCVMVDRNNGQLDIANRMVFPMPELERVFASFDWPAQVVCFFAPATSLENYKMYEGVDFPD